MKLKICLILCILLSGCAGPHSLLFEKTENGYIIRTDPKDKTIFGRKALPSGKYAIKPNEYGIEGSADYKPDYKLIEVVVNKNEGL